MSVLYLDHFELTTDPFRITPDTEFFFSGGQRGDILEGLLVAAMHDEGIVAVVGEIGMGKTMLSRMLLERLKGHPADTVYLANPVFDRNEILDAIARDLMPDPPRGSRLHIISELERVLIQRFSQDRRVIVVIDEAHTMPGATLEEIRLLSNLETAHNKLLKIILFGQPELDELLNATQLRQVKDRISHRFVLQPLDAAEARTYLDFRLRKAGHSGVDIFEQDACNLLWRASQGRTRKLNMLAEKSLLAAFACGRATVGLNEARRACQDESTEVRRVSPFPLEIESSNSTTRKNFVQISRRRIFFGLALGGALVAAALMGYAFSRLSLEKASANLAPQMAGVVAVAPIAQATAAQSRAVDGSTLISSNPMSPAPTASVPKNIPIEIEKNESPTSATPAAPVDMGTAPITNDWLAEIVKQSETFIARTQGVGYTVQMLALRAPQPEQLRTRLSEYHTQFGSKQLILVNQRAYNGIVHHAVYLGSFPSREKAAEYIATLPEAIRREKPMIRSFSRILEEPKS